MDTREAPIQTYTITHEDGSAVTPQEVYDAFMSGPVILEVQGSDYGNVSVVNGLDYEGTPDNITGCTIVSTGGDITIGGA